MPDNTIADNVLVIVGPTGVGKTDLALELATEIDGEIISADSRLFYRGMDIGTAKPTLEQRQQVKHYLIDVAEADEVWSLSVFQQKVKEAMQVIQRRGKKVILVGGTGQYVRAITEGWQIPPQQPDERFRIVLEKWGKQIGAEELHRKLTIIDPVAAAKIDPQNIRRTIRALEVILMTGVLFSSQKMKITPEEKFWMIGLMRPRAELYARIDARIEEMFTNGFIEETRKLIEKGLPLENPNLSAIGYREICQYLGGSLSIEGAKIEMRKKTREFVRRQTNWFKLDDPAIHWYDMNDNPLHKILEDLRQEKIVS
jgi:tRNA dimethylallyltransferase